MKVALVYDRVNKWGGAERVLLTLHEMFPPAPLYTSVHNPKTTPWARVFPRVYTSFLQGVPLRTQHEVLASLMPLAFESFNFDEYDLVISLTSEAAKGIITKPKTLHICYCLTPTRYLWSGYEDSFRNPYLRFLSKPIVSYLRMWDKIASQRPDHYLAISKEVQKRIKKYYGRESEVVYPPVTLEHPRGVPQAQHHLGGGRLAPRSLGEAGMDSPEVNLARKGAPYFLVVSRLVPYKRVDITVEAFNELGWFLKIVGTGHEMGKLRRKARQNIEFLGNLTDKELMKYYEGCRALVFSGVEDFGLSIVEAQAAGKPVVAYKKGGALESIRPGRTGEFFEPQTKEALIKVLKDFNDKDYSREDCIKNAERFSKEKFIKELSSYIAKCHNF